MPDFTACKKFHFRDDFASGHEFRTACGKIRVLSALCQGATHRAEMISPLFLSFRRLQPQGICFFYFSAGFSLAKSFLRFRRALAPAFEAQFKVNSYV